MNFDFMGGSMGCALGEGFSPRRGSRSLQEAAFVVVTASGGARMQEGALSLMQMPRTTIAVEEVKEAGLPYIVILTDPTTGGVTASFAMLGDIAIAEPGAQIGFAGQRVIEQTIREKLPEGFQRAEYLLAHGMIDMVVHRFELRATLARIMRLLLRPNLDPDAEQPVERQRRVAEQALPAPAAAADGERRRRSRCPRSRTAGARAVTSYGSDLILARLQGLHPKTIDLSLEPHRAAAGGARPSRAAAARRSSTSPAPTARARRSRCSTRCSRPPAGASQRYISPHLVHFNERFLFDGEPIAEPELADVPRPLRAGQRRPADHRVRDHHRRGLPRLRAPRRRTCC